MCDVTASKLKVSVCFLNSNFFKLKLKDVLDER